MQLQELKPGDILVFKSHEDSKLSKIISILTNSDVSHATIVDEDTNYLLEASLEGGARTLIQSYSPRTAYVRRFESCPNPAYAVEIANAYVQTAFPYSYTELIASGLYIISGKIAPYLNHGKLLCIVLEVATYALAKAIDYHKNGGKEAMICSELVFRSYAEAALSHGSAYEIHFTQESSGYISILDYLLDYVSKSSPETTLELTTDSTAYMNMENAISALEDCYEELYEIHNTVEADSCIAPAADVKIDPVLLQKVGLFCRLFLNLKGVSIDNNASLSEILAAMLRIKAVFVSPADLCYHSTNLTDYGTLDY